VGGSNTSVRIRSSVTAQVVGDSYQMRVSPYASKTVSADTMVAQVVRDPQLA
jgi:hypothetical protein